MKVIVAPYKYLSTIYTTKWLNYIKHLIEDYGWKLVDFSDRVDFLIHSTIKKKKTLKYI